MQISKHYIPRKIKITIIAFKITMMQKMMINPVIYREFFEDKFTKTAVAPDSLNTSYLKDINCM